MEVKVFKLKEIKLLSGDALNVKQCCMVQPILPTYGKEGDACMDIYPICYEYDVDKDRFIYHTGLALILEMMLMVNLMKCLYVLEVILLNLTLICLMLLVL